MKEIAEKYILKYSHVLKQEMQSVETDAFADKHVVLSIDESCSNCCKNSNKDWFDVDSLPDAVSENLRARIDDWRSNSLELVVCDDNEYEAILKEHTEEGLLLCSLLQNELGEEWRVEYEKTFE